MRLRGKTALVTGAAMGFGRAIAETFVDAGANVVLVDLNQAAVQEVADRLGTKARASRGDVGNVSDVAAMVNLAKATFGGLDIVVNNAGIVNHKAPLEDTDEDFFDRIFATNVKSLFCTARAAVPLMKNRGGSIINLGSTGAIRPRPGLTWYNGSKGAVHAITKSMAIELAPHRIRVNCIAPVMAPTGMMRPALGGQDTPEAREAVIATIPLGRMCSPADVANACVWLADDASNFLTGVVLPVDGGRSI